MSQSNESLPKKIRKKKSCPELIESVSISFLIDKSEINDTKKIEKTAAAAAI